MAPKPKLTIWILNVALLILASAALMRIMTKDGLSSFDFHCFWYGGNHIWQGTDPYRAFIEKQNVTLPRTYIDGITVQEGPIDPFDTQCAPGNTAPVLFLLSPLALFSWDTAHRIWFILNTIFAVAIGGIFLKMLNQAAASGEGVLLFLLIMVQLSTRETLELGQTSLLITLCMLLALFFSYRDRAGDGEQNRARKGSIRAGIFLGLALSKPLLSFPLLLLFLYRRRAVELVVAAFVQIAGIYWLTRLGTSFPVAMADYARIFMMHAGPGTQDGVYLTAGLLKGCEPYSYWLIAAGSISLGVILLKWLFTVSKTDSSNANTDREELLNASKNDRIDLKTDFVLLTVLMLWNLLVFYHRRYDYVAASFFITLVVFLRAFSFRVPSFSLKQKLGVYGTAFVTLSIWVFPFYRAMSEAAYRSLFNLCTLAALVLTTWLLFKLKPG